VTSVGAPTFWVQATHVERHDLKNPHSDGVLGSRNCSWIEKKQDRILASLPPAGSEWRLGGQGRALQGLLEVLILDFCDRFLRKNVGAPTSRTPNPTECGIASANSSKRL
jgi:hypothetical protein